MPKVVLTDLQSLQNEQMAVARINANFQAVQTVIDTLLSRDGSVPNQMIAVVDMNENRIVNLAAPVDPNDAARFKEIQDFYALVIAEAERAEDAADLAEGFRDSASNFASAASGSATSANNSALAAALSEQSAEEDAERAEAAAELLETYELSVFITGEYRGSELIYSSASTRTIGFRTTSTGYARAGVASTGTATFSLQKNGVQFGTVTFASSTSGTITITSDTDIEPGDTFSIVAPSAPDQTLRDVSVSVQAVRL